MDGSTLRTNMQEVIHGNCLEVLKQFPDNTFDSIVTDPPYGLAFMNKKWDYDVPSIEIWQEVLRVLKPGGHLLSFGGSRTYHRMACRIEDAGFKPKEMCVWLYGSGFPKSFNLHKYNNNISDGIGTALKPAFEPILWATKEFKEDIIINNISILIEELLWQSIEKLEKMDISKLQGMVSISLNIVLLWKIILEELSQKENKFITLMESKLITELKILNSLLLKIMPENMDGESQIYQNLTQKLKANGSYSFVSIVENILKDEKLNTEGILKLIAQGLAIYRQKENHTHVKNVEIDLIPTILNVNFVLLNVLTNLIIEKENQQLHMFVSFVENNLKQYLVDPQNIVMLNVWLKDIKNVTKNNNMIIAQKPLSEKNIAENILKWGTGGINIDDCRIGTESRTYDLKGGENLNQLSREDGNDNPDAKGCGAYGQGAKQISIGKKTVTGRFPANLILDEEAGQLLDEQTGVLKSGTLTPENNVKECTGWTGGSQANRVKNTFMASEGGASRFFYCAKTSQKERNIGLEDFETKKVSDGREKEADNAFQRGKTERHNTHPTVKPMSLMSYLIKLITPKNGIVLDPFCGSGSTGMACKELGFDFIGIEKEEEYVAIAKARIAGISTK
jgi:DNA modification methylase